MAQLADQVFQDLASELEHQGVSRKVSANMFGMGLRSYQRRVCRLTESSGERGRSLWEAVLDYIREHGITPRTEILRAFVAEDDVLLRGVLFDLCESRLVLQAGQGIQSVYRAVSPEEMGALGAVRSSEGLDELVWAMVYREGPLTREDLLQRTHIERTELDPALQRLVATARVERADDESGGVKYRAAALYVPLGSPVGWEAAIFDHYQAMVKTILCRRREDRAAPGIADRVGGSTYTLDVWPGHPLEERAQETLGRLRTTLVELREQVEAYNAANETPDRYTQVVLYVGQCLIQQDRGGGDEGLAARGDSSTDRRGMSSARRCRLPKDWAAGGERNQLPPGLHRELRGRARVRLRGLHSTVRGEQRLRTVGAERDVLRRRDVLHRRVRGRLLRPVLLCRRGLRVARHGIPLRGRPLPPAGLRGGRKTTNPTIPRSR